MAINAAGTITGFYYDSSGVGHGFLRFRHGIFKTFNVPGAITITPLPAGTAYTTPVGINSSGGTTGYYSDASLSTFGFVRSHNGRYTVINAPGAAGFTKALGINHRGTTFGINVDENGAQHAFVRSRAGSFTDFDPPGSNTVPVSINPAGAITGSSNGHGCLRIPNNN
jgi:hypothetical protein